LKTKLLGLFLQEYIFRLVTLITIVEVCGTKIWSIFCMWYHFFSFCYWQSNTSAFRPAVKVPMNLLSKTLPEGSQNQSSADTYSSPVSLGVTTSGASVAASSSLDLDFLIGQDVNTGSNETADGPGRGGGGSDGDGDGDGGGGGGSSLGGSCTSSDLLNGMFTSF
jgi:hypothetical protein